MKEGIYIILNPNKINRDNGTEIPEACTWIPTMRKHLNQRHTKNQRTPEEIMVHGNNSRIEMHQLQQTTMIHNAVPQPVDPIAWRRLAVSSRNVAFHIKWPCRETTEQTYIIKLLKVFFSFCFRDDGDLRLKREEIIFYFQNRCGLWLKSNNSTLWLKVRPYDI